MERKITDAQLRASKKYQDKLNIITIKVPQEQGQKIREDAKKSGMSLTQYILSKLNN